MMTITASSSMSVKPERGAERDGTAEGQGAQPIGTAHRLMPLWDMAVAIPLEVAF